MEKNTKQKETTGIFNNSKVNTQVESFMDNIKKLDNDISEEMKTEFKKAVQKYGFADIITIIRNYKQTDHSSENIVMVGNTERESVLSSNKESVKKETHIYETSQKASEKITSKHEELNTIDTLINIMNEVSNENTIESFQQKTESYLEKCNDISVTQIKEKINLLYPKYGSDLVY